MQLLEWTEQYLAFLVAKGNSKTSRQKYVSSLRHYAAWWQKEKGRAPHLAAFCYKEMLAYLEAEAKRGLRPRSRYGKVSAFRSFGRWLVETEVLKENPAARLPLPRLDDPQREMISGEEVAALLLACERFPFQERGILAKAVLVTFLTTGVRRAELLALLLDDIDLSERHLLVRCGKGGKSRLLPLNEDAVESLSAWLAVRNPCAKTSALFLRGRQNALSSYSLSTLIKDIQAIAGFRGKKNQNPHSQRYFFTDQLVESWTDIKTIQELLGHQNVETTLLYVRSNMERKRRAVESIQLPATEPKPTLTDKKKSRRRISLKR